MENNKNEKMQQQMKRTLIMSGIAFIICTGRLIGITRNSNIRTVDMLVILGCGIAIGAFIANLMLTIRMKKHSVN